MNNDIVLEGRSQCGNEVCARTVSIVRKRGVRFQHQYGNLALTTPLKILTLLLLHPHYLQPFLKPTTSPTIHGDIIPGNDHPITHRDSG
jgi:hypothetical protein